MTNADEVQTIRATSKRRRNRAQSRGHETQNDLGHRYDKNDKNRTCKYCDRKHEARKESCPAYGKTC